VNTEQIVGVVIRLFAVILLIYSMRNLAGSLPSFTNNPSFSGSVLVIYIFMILPMLLAIIFWYFPISIAKKIIPDYKKDEKSFLVVRNELENIAFIVLGAWILSSAIVTVIAEQARECGFLGLKMV